jgi:hypothetical protein
MERQLKNAKPKKRITPVPTDKFMSLTCKFFISGKVGDIFTGWLNSIKFLLNHFHSY